MPDESGRFRGISVPGDKWERVFGKRRQRCPAAELGARGCFCTGACHRPPPRDLHAKDQHREIKRWGHG